MLEELLFTIFITWVLFIPIAVINGVIRDKIYQPKIGETLAHQVSTFTASSLFIGLSYFLLRHQLSSLDLVDLFKTGAMWVMLTIVFEFIVGHFVFNNSWKKLLHDYNLFNGRVWVIFLLLLLFTPLIITQL